MRCSFKSKLGGILMNIIFLDVDGVLNSVNKLIETYNKTQRSHSVYSYSLDK